MSVDKPTGLIKALSDDDWSIVRSRGMHWCLAADHRVVLTDPTTGNKATARTLKLAYDKHGIKG